MFETRVNAVFEEINETWNVRPSMMITSPFESSDVNKVPVPLKEVPVISTVPVRVAL